MKAIIRVSPIAGLILAISPTVRAQYDGDYILSFVSQGNSKLAPFALVVGVNYYRGAAKLDASMPISYVPPLFGTTTGVPVNAGSTNFNFDHIENTEARFGLRIYSWIEVGAVHSESNLIDSLPADNPYSNDYHTLWGGYQEGNYAAIASVYLANAWGPYVQVMWPPIHISPNWSFQPFLYYSYISHSLDFESGYHRYAVPFNPAYITEQLGTVSQEIGRAGIEFLHHFADWFYFGLKAYVENDFWNLSATSIGSTFNLSYDRPKAHAGGGANIIIKF